MNAELSVYPLTATETQLDFLGRSEPPLAIIGGALDAMAGHRIAEASVIASSPTSRTICAST